MASAGGVGTAGDSTRITVSNQKVLPPSARDSIPMSPFIIRTS
jgi:hypothetical protein